MAVTRRRFVQNTTAASAAAVAAPYLLPQLTAAQEPEVILAAGTPAPEAIALHRMAYGPRPGDVARVKQIGLAAYIEEQLNPNPSDDAACTTRLNNIKLKIQYDMDMSSVNELRSIAPVLSKTTAELWAEVVVPDKPFAEYNIIWQMVRTAAYVRATYSKWQLNEVLVDFWHDHFNVRPNGDRSVSVGFPEYDRIIRQNAFGNFRTFLEAIGRSTSMLFDLDNASNIASGGEGGNENYARELFELHTLGSDNYLKFYSDRTKIGTITYGGETFARGYIDDDVYEAARCFTGWTVAYGSWPQPNGTPSTGQFLYLSQWHDTSPKTVLLVPQNGNYLPNIPARQPDLFDGKKVYDLLARHPGTARNICTKLVRRFISDTPPANVVEAAVAKWMATRDSADQIRQVLRVILTSDEFRMTWGAKLKRPFEYVIGYLRATEAELPSDVDSLPTSDTDPTPDRTKGGYWGNINWNMSQTGHRLFEWPTPTGHPDRASYWGNSNSMLRRWNLLSFFEQDYEWGGNAGIDLWAKTNMAKPCAEIVDDWIERLFGDRSFPVTPTVRQAVIDFLAMKINGGDPSKPPAATRNEDANNPDTLHERLEGTVHLLAMSPDYQRR